MPFEETKRGERWVKQDVLSPTPQKELESMTRCINMLNTAAHGTFPRNDPIYVEFEEQIKKLKPLISNWPEEEKKLKIEKLEDEIELFDERGWCRRAYTSRQELKELKRTPPELGGLCWI